jgi:structural maintenance of chromosome 1
MGYVESLELENFKSFKGSHVIGPFKQFTAVIGPNGSGKSNLMDAISFVLGERSNQLRVRKLTDLIHGASVGHPASKTCRVTMNYFDDDKTQKSFTRSVTSGGTEYRINNEVVASAEYHRQLEEIQIFIKARNFLVYQGRVEQVAMQNPKDLTEMFEELSRSNEFQAEYNRLKQECEKAESAAQQTLSKRREIVQEKREAKQEKDEAHKYQKLREDLGNKNQELYLIKLYFAEHAQKKAKEQLEKVREDLDDIKEGRKEHEEKIASKQREVKDRHREMQKLEQKAQKKVSD